MAELCNVDTYCRADFRLDKNLRPYILEVNTLPGFTNLSLLPLAAKHDGISFEDLVDTILKKASLVTAP